MKKYLMTGIAAVAMCAAFTSCSKDLGFEQMTPEEAVQASYETAFIQAFGQPAPDQDWGFGTTTRSLTRGENDNSCGTCIKPDMTNYPSDIAPNPITTDEAAYVKEWFETHPGFTEGLDFHNFFIQQVYGEASKQYNVWYNHYDQNHNPQWYRDDYSEAGTMDYFCVGDGTNYTHPYDFNSNNCGTQWKTVYMQNSSALSFKTHMSWSSEEWKFFKCAKINVPGVGEGWYVGMCMYGEKYDNGDRKMNKDMKDLQYADDWIVKIIPNDPITPPTKYQGRIMAEDLTVRPNGSDSDFDFNDVVFDWKIEGKVATIQLRAIGGTLPLYVGGVEVHGKFGARINQMVNTGVDTMDEPEAYTYTFPEGVTAIPENIPIVVTRSTGDVELTAVRGKVASKINVPTTTKWVKEYQDIENAYPQFKDWVSDPSVNWTSNYNTAYIY